MRETRCVFCFVICAVCVSMDAAEPDAATLVSRVIEAACGKDRLLKRFRITERYSAGAERAPSGTPRTSVIEPPKYWWVGTSERGQEAAKVTVWAWTLGVLTDAESRISTIPHVMENGKELYGLRVTGSVDPALDMYFDREHSRLTRIDWRNDIYIFGKWQKYDGTVYPARTTMYRRKTRQPWFHHEILNLERLRRLPENLKRK